jgi:hypothetical protein
VTDPDNTLVTVTVAIQYNFMAHRLSSRVVSAFSSAFVSELAAKLLPGQSAAASEARCVHASGAEFCVKPHEFLTRAPRRRFVVNYVSSDSVVTFYITAATSASTTSSKSLATALSAAVCAS